MGVENKFRLVDVWVGVRDPGLVTKVEYDLIVWRAVSVSALLSEVSRRQDLRQRFRRGVGIGSEKRMSQVKARKVPTPEFKAKVGLEDWRGLKTINVIGQEHGFHPVQAGQREQAIQEKAKTLFEGKCGPKPVAAHRGPELRCSEIGKLRVELDWLNKSLGSARRDTKSVDRTWGGGGRGAAMRPGRHGAGSEHHRRHTAHQV